VVAKSIDRTKSIEYSDPKASQIDKLVYEIRRLIHAEGPSAPFLEEVVYALRADELRLPILPDSVSRVMRLVDKPEVNMGELAQVIELDPVLAVKTVGVANSAYYRGAEPAVSVHQALMRMGLGHARNVVVAVALRSSLFRVAGYESEAQEVWLHSLYSALATQAVLSEIPPWQDSGFLLGLSHDIGRIAMLNFAAEARGRDRKHRGPDRAVVQEVSDLIHAGLGALAVDSWGFSEEFSRVIADHHKSNTIEDHRIVLARALAVGDAIAHHVRDGGPVEDVSMDKGLMELLESVGQDQSRGLNLIFEVQKGFDAFAKLV